MVDDARLRVRQPVFAHRGFICRQRILPELANALIEECAAYRQFGYHFGKLESQVLEFADRLKSPAGSKEPWDCYRILSEISPDVAWRPLSDRACPFLK